MNITRTNAALIVALVPLTTLLLWDLSQARPPAIAEVVWPGFSTPAVDSLRVVRQEGEIEVFRTGVDWTLGRGGEPADADGIKALLRLFSKPIRPDVRVAGAGTDPELYGLGDAERVAVEAFAQGERVLGLELGRALAGGSSFVRPLGEDAVYRARVPGRFRLERPREQWRDHRVVGLDKGKVVEVTVERPDGTWHFQRRTEDWACLERPEMLLDARLAEGMARTLAGLRATEIVDSPTAEEFGEVSLRVEAVSLEQGTRTVEFGAASADGSLRYARSGGRTFLVATSRIETFDHPPSDLRDRDVVKLDWREVERVTVRQGERRFVAVPTGEHAWRLVEPAGYSIDVREMGFSLDALIELRAFELADDVPKSATGVDGDGALIVRIERVEAAPVAVRVGPLRGSVHYVRREGRDQTYSLRVPSARALTQGFGLVWDAE